MRTKNLCLALFFGLSSFTTIFTKTINLGIFDTTHNEKYLYQPFIDIAQSTDFIIEYKSIGQILDTDFKKEDLQKYDGILFVMDTEFFIGSTKDNSPVTNKILTIVKKFSALPKKLISFAFDTFLAPRILKENLNAVLHNIFQCSGLISLLKNPTLSNSLTSFFKIPMEARRGAYHTTLSNPSYKVPHIKTIKTVNAATLPINQNGISQTIKYTFPYGLYIGNPASKTHFFITTTSLISGLGISENYRFCPMHFNLRKQIYNAIQQMMWELNQIITQKELSWEFKEFFEKRKKPVKEATLDIRKITFTNKPNLPQSVEYSVPITHGKKHTKVSWMQIHFFENPQNETEKQDRLIESILKAGNDIPLWLSLKINLHLSDKAIYGSTFKDLSTFTKKLAVQAKKQNMKPPKIVLGFEIANNIRNANKKITQTMALSKYAVFDLYGNIYPYCANLVDKEFWDHEVKKPLSTFLEIWKNPQTNNGIKIAGIALDFEPYFSQFPAHFFSSIGFNPQNLTQFYPSIKWEYRPKLIQTNIQKLIDTKKVAQYFSFIEAQAKSIGDDLKNFVNKALPNGIIGCYMPQFLINPFYKGFYKGISDPKKPCFLMTFNTLVNKNWLEENNIHAKHLVAFMLGKCDDKTFNSWLNYFKTHNLNFWLNRFSKFMDIKTKGDDVEQPYMSEKTRPVFFTILKKM